MSSRADLPFEQAVEAVVGGNGKALSALLDHWPDLVRARSARSHRSTLLHYVSANGVEDERQTTPANIVEIAKLLLDRGADVNAESDAYGGGATVLGLVATSVHPERAGVQEALMTVLFDRGAVIGDAQRAVGDCLANGRPRAALFLAEREADHDLACAALAGRLDAVHGLVERQFNPVQLQRAFIWACRFGQTDVATFLLSRGADPENPADTGGTALHWAAGGAHVETVRMLLERGAPLELRNRWDGTVLEFTGWAWAHDCEARDFFPVFEVLLSAGAHVGEGWLGWTDSLVDRSADERSRLKGLLARYGAVN